jgi:hypothetical protein
VVINALSVGAPMYIVHGDVVSIELSRCLVSILLFVKSVFVTIAFTGAIAIQQGLKC